MRLNKFLAKWGYVSRRKAEDLIQSGKVFINGKKILDAHQDVEPQKDRVRIQKKYIEAKNQKLVYLMFHKPSKMLSTSSDPKGRLTVMDCIPYNKERLFLVGRLDWDSEGLLLITNDGDFSNRILKPKNYIPKTYCIKVKGTPTISDLKKITKGVSTPVGKRKALFAKYNRRGEIKVILKEGKNRQIRFMFEKIGFPVKKLKRVAIGRLKLNRLPKRRFTSLREQDLKKIFLLPKELKK
ncbi:MAG: rRNA pseudouridine synthase [Bdellovibrionales bacterium]|nr:rRNA pseudouridine synthase [Bdellovibrionales bacterium]